MSNIHPKYDPNDQAAVRCYRTALRALEDARVEFLVGGAYSFARYTGVARHTKDFDIFLRQRDCQAACQALAAAGYRTEVTYTHWLAKAFCNDYFIDLIFGSGNGICRVDDTWFAHAVPGEALGHPVRFCPAEESIWSKAFIMERGRYDGADIVHLLRTQAARMDWHRLLDRFGPLWRVLYTHLILFGFVYPDESRQVPEWLMRELAARLETELQATPPVERLCRGTLLAALQYEIDVEEWGYADARLPPYGSMTTEQVRAWAQGIRMGR
jgi:hypothetical protein